jgi:hypothetical protein
MTFHNLVGALTFQAIRECYGRSWWKSSAWQVATPIRAELYPEPRLRRCDCGLLFEFVGEELECQDCRHPAPEALVVRMPGRGRG